VYVVNINIHAKVLALLAIVIAIGEIIQALKELKIGLFGIIVYCQAICVFI
jgi:hypothetical protein